MDTDNTPKPLGIERSGYGEGLTQDEAFANWLATDSSFLDIVSGMRVGIQALDTTKPVEFTQLRAPKLAKKCKVNSIVQAGARKWQTLHVLVDSSGAEVGTAATKAEAVKLAKQLALSSNTAIAIRIDKRLQAGEETVATVTPKESKPGRWKFRAMFKW